MSILKIPFLEREIKQRRRRRNMDMKAIGKNTGCISPKVSRVN